MNLLKNSGFELSWWHPASPKDGAPVKEFQIPEGYTKFWWTQHADTETPGMWRALPDTTAKISGPLANPFDSSAGARFVRPEIRVMLREQVPAWEQTAFGMQGNHILKIFKGNGSFWCGLTQIIPDLPQGDYQFKFQLYPDSYQWTGEKSFGADPNTILVKFGPNGEFRSFNPSPDLPAESRLQHHIYEFSHSGGEYIFYIEFLCPFPMDNNGIFCDAWELVPVGEVEPPAPTGGSRLGTHSIAVASEYGDTLGLLRHWKEQGGAPSIIKGVSDLGWLAEAREIFPDVPIIARVASPIEGCQGVEDPNADLPAMAAALMKLITDKIKAQPELEHIVTYWEPVNEPDPPGGIGYMQLSKLMIECMDIAERGGLRLALFSLNAGTPEWDEMQAMIETGVFLRAKQGYHVLALHEGVFDDQPINQWYGDLILGAPVVTGAGALCFRYRYLYHLLGQHRQVLPLIVSEFRTHGANYPISTTEVLKRWAWYDERARDDYLLGVTPFTLGATGQWFPSHDYGKDYRDGLIDWAVDFDGGPVEPPDSGRGKPRVQYERTYVLIPPDEGADLVVEIARRFFDANRFTLGGSADDAGVADLDVRNVVAVQPDRWGDSLQAFFEQYYPGVSYIPVSGDNNYKLMGRVLSGLLKARGLTLAPPLDRELYVTSEFGVFRDDAAGTYYHNGVDYRAEMETSVLASYAGKVITAGYDESEPWFGWQVKTVSTTPDGKKIQLRYAHLFEDGVFVSAGDEVKIGQKIALSNNTGNSTGPHLHLDCNIAGYYADPAMLISQDIPVPHVAIGLHDANGGEWMRNNGLTGYVLAHRPIHETAQPVDFSALEQAGIQVIMRWNYDYGGVGTFPPTALTEQWIAAMVESINNSKGVYLHTIGNEWNNPVEWVGGYPNPTEALTPARALSLYNRIAAQVRSDLLLAPGAVDPYNVVAQEFGQPGDPRVWFDAMHNSVDRIDAILLHAKTQSNDPIECSSDEKFSDEPLTGRYLHLRTYLDQLGWVREGLRGLPVFITELNPQRIDTTRLGWVADNAAWVAAAIAELDRYNGTGGQPITGVCFYRWEADDWKLQDKPTVLGEIVRQARR